LGTPANWVQLTAVAHFLRLCAAEGARFTAVWSGNGRFDRRISL